MKLLRAFTWNPLSLFHLASVAKQKQRQDEKEVVSQRSERDSAHGQVFKDNPLDLDGFSFSFFWPLSVILGNSISFLYIGVCIYIYI